MSLLCEYVCVCVCVVCLVWCVSVCVCVCVCVFAGEDSRVRTSLISCTECAACVCVCGVCGCVAFTFSSMDILMLIMNILQGPLMLACDKLSGRGHQACKCLV